MNYFYDYWPEVSAFIKKCFYFLSICFQLLIFGSSNSKVQALITRLAYLWIFLFPLSLCHLSFSFGHFLQLWTLSSTAEIQPYTWYRYHVLLTNNDVFLFTFSCIILVLINAYKIFFFLKIDRKPRNFTSKFQFLKYGSVSQFCFLSTVILLSLTGNQHFLTDSQKCTI